MNLDKIMEYVSHTPSNTNPLMVKQMAREYAEHPVEELKKSGGVGHTEPGKVITWDGDITGKEQSIFDENAYKVSDEAVDLSKVKAVTVFDPLSNALFGTPVERTVDFVYSMDENGVQALTDGDSAFYAVATSENITIEGTVIPKGLYLTQNHTPEGVMVLYVSKLEFTETIHPIDPKFLPGVCLPVVELTTQPTEDGAPLTAEENAAMESVFQTGLPCVVRLKIYSDTMSYTTANVFLHASVEFDGLSNDFYGCETSGTNHRIQRTDTGWIFTMS